MRANLEHCGVSLRFLRGGIEAPEGWVADSGCRGKIIGRYKRLSFMRPFVRCLTESPRDTKFRYDITSTSGVRLWPAAATAGPLARCTTLAHLSGPQIHRIRRRLGYENGTADFLLQLHHQARANRRLLQSDDASRFLTDCALAPPPDREGTRRS
jgi:hypothetical protein